MIFASVRSLLRFSGSQLFSGPDGQDFFEADGHIFLSGVGEELKRESVDLYSSGAQKHDFIEMRMLLCLLEESEKSCLLKCLQ